MPLSQLSSDNQDTENMLKDIQHPNLIRGMLTSEGLGRGDIVSAFIDCYRGLATIVGIRHEHVRLILAGVCHLDWPWQAAAEARKLFERVLLEWRRTNCRVDFLNNGTIAELSQGTVPPSQSRSLLPRDSFFCIFGGAVRPPHEALRYPAHECRTDGADVCVDLLEILHDLLFGVASP